MKRLMTLVFSVATTFILLSAYSTAQIYKCKNSAGQMVFSDKKCGKQAELVKVKPINQLQRTPPKTFYCPSGITAVINNLHYPTLKDVNEAIRLVESDLTGLRYRKLIKRVDPADVLPDKVSKIKAEATHASKVPGFSNGVVVNAQICK